MYNMDLLDTFQFSQTKYEICSDEETLKGKYCFETPILGKGNLKPLSRETGAPFQTGMLGPLHRICTMVYTPFPDRL